jgi:hypothetical protein
LGDVLVKAWDTWEGKGNSIHGRVLGVGVVGGCNLDEIRPNEVQAIQPAENRAQFPGGPASRFWRAGGRGN